MAEQQKKQQRMIPQSELELAWLTAEPAWGKPEVPQELLDRLNKEYVVVGEDGQQSISIDSLWGVLGYYTRDVRLANLSGWNGELERCRYLLDLAGDFLNHGYIQAFGAALLRSITIMETSQSKGGFVRRRMGTFSQEHLEGPIEPQKKSLFGGSKKKGGD